MSNSSRTVSTGVAYALMLFTVCIWASAFAGIRYLVTQVDPLTFTAARLAVATLVITVGGMVAGFRWPNGRDVPRILAAGLLGFSLYHVALNYGVQRISAGQSSFVVSTIPIWTSVLAWLFLGERLGGRHWAGLVVSVCGVALMSLSRTDLDLPLGSALVLVAAWCAAGNFVLQKGLLASYEPTLLTAYVTVIGSAPLIALLPLGWPQLAALSGFSWLVIVYLGVVPIALGYWLSTIALQALPASRTSQMLLLIPPIAALIAWATLGERPTVRMAVGGALVVAGVALSLSARTRRER